MSNTCGKEIVKALFPNYVCETVNISKVMAMKAFTTKELKKVKNKMKLGMVPGLDRVPSEVVKKTVKTHA